MRFRPWRFVVAAYEAAGKVCSRRVSRRAVAVPFVVVRGKGRLRVAAAIEARTLAWIGQSLGWPSIRPTEVANHVVALGYIDSLGLPLVRISGCPHARG